ncbi:DUF2306 domain-containing protein [Polynucleobacter sp. MWH-UH23A]|uniref:DUF2306 domain-containing protein n=1 Tax=Polynucleobacter sp. MWH-UH23A TaxID=1855613 RepID=UPI003364BFE1
MDNLIQGSNQSSESSIYKASLLFLVITSWVSGISFALYIFAFYILANTLSAVEAWNSVLPQLYSPTKPAAMTGMISHFFFGSLLLIMGPIQFSETIRKRFTDFHRWTGLFYTLSAFVTGLGGVVFLAVWGAAGGTPMLVGFALYGILMMLGSVQTVRYALLRQFELHRQWAIRLFALVLGSWIYRMGYGFIHTTLGGWGLGVNFSGPLDYFMDFAFFVIPLMVAEIVIRKRKGAVHSFWSFSGTAICLITGLLICRETYYFLATSWGGPIGSLFGA